MDNSTTINSWRPEGWKNPHKELKSQAWREQREGVSYHDLRMQAEAFEAGADAMLKAFRKAVAKKASDLMGAPAVELLEDEELFPGYQSK